MKSRFPEIDPNQVYVTGLSSGGAMALLAGCKAPDVFAGVGAIEGPSVGSNQDHAFNNPPSGNVDHALAKCKDLAGVKSEAFSTQITSVGYGDLDKNGGGKSPCHRRRASELSFQWSGPKIMPRCWPSSFSPARSVAPVVLLTGRPRRLCARPRTESSVCPC